MTVKDTSEDYDDFVGYESEDLKISDLSELLDMESDTKPAIRPKPVDPNFPEDWQNLYVNFMDFAGYADFMKIIGEFPTPNLKTLVFTKEKDDGLLTFLGD